MAKSGPTLVDQRLVKAVSNPTRVDILNILFEEASSPSKVARRLKNVSVNLVSHHIKVLRDLGCVELVEEVKHGGRTERIYRAVKQHFFSNAEWEQVDPKDGYPITLDILRMISEDIAESLLAGRFDRLRDRHLSRSPLEVDQEGWREITDILDRALQEVQEVSERSTERAQRGEDLMKIRVVMMHFLRGPLGEDGKAT
jgi:DNA-binding transcriptional ArsR family regulator